MDQPLAVVGKRQLVTWENGSPVVKNVPMVTPGVLNDLGSAALAELYSEPGDELALEMGLPPSEFYGRPLAEVMLIKQARNAARDGNTEDIEAILDRRLGKPKATLESHSVTESYEQYLKRIAASETAERVAAAQPIDAEVAPPWEDL